MSLTSGSELCVLLFRVSASAYFREIPCPSVANSCAFASAFACSYFREIPCPSVANLLPLLILQPSLTLPALNDVFLFREIPWLILCFLAT